MQNLKTTKILYKGKQKESMFIGSGALFTYILFTSYIYIPYISRQIID